MGDGRRGVLASRPRVPSREEEDVWKVFASNLSPGRTLLRDRPHWNKKNGEYGRSERRRDKQRLKGRESLAKVTNHPLSLIQIKRIQILSTTVSPVG